MLYWFKTALHRAKKGIAASLIVWLAFAQLQAFSVIGRKQQQSPRDQLRKGKNTMQYFCLSPMPQPSLEKRREGQGEASKAGEGLDAGQV